MCMRRIVFSSAPEASASPLISSSKYEPVYCLVMSYSRSRAASSLQVKVNYQLQLLRADMGLLYLPYVCNVIQEPFWEDIDSSIDCFNLSYM